MMRFLILFLIILTNTKLCFSAQGDIRYSQENNSGSFISSTWTGAGLLYKTGTNASVINTNSDFTVSGTSIRLSGTISTDHVFSSTNNTYSGLRILATSGTLSVLNLKNLTINNSLTLAGTDFSTLNISTGGTLGTAAFQNITLSGNQTFTGSNAFTGSTSISSLSLGLVNSGTLSGITLSGTTTNTGTISGGTFVGSVSLTGTLNVNRIVPTGTTPTGSNLTILGGPTTNSTGNETGGSLIITSGSAAATGTDQSGNITIKTSDQLSGAYNTTGDITIDNGSTTNACGSLLIGTGTQVGSSGGSITMGSINRLLTLYSNSLTISASTYNVTSDTTTVTGTTYLSLAGNTTVLNSDTTSITGTSYFHVTSNSLQLSGSVGIQGTTSADDASDGNVGQYVTGTKSQSSPLSLSSGTWADVISATIPSGDWDVTGILGVTGSTAGTVLQAAVTQNSGNTSSGVILGFNSLQGTQMPNSVCDVNIIVPALRININSDTIYYLKAFITKSSGSPLGYGSIIARRIR